ncbi:MAG: PEP-CTERM sorting domain-containing protein [Verrucomicrobiota bacterium]
MRIPSRCCLFTVVSFGAIIPATAITINVLPGVNNVPITSVTYGIPGSPDVVQTNPAVGVTGPLTNTAVNVKSVQVNNGGLLVDLNFVNTMGATVVNVNPQLASISGIGVFNHNLTTPSNGPGGLAAFTSALEATASDFDLRNYCYYDFVPAGSPTLNVPDYDILYTEPMKPSDYLLVSERNGNTYFEVTPLKQDGTPFEFANKLLFGGPGGPSYSVYDWNSGYAAAGNFPDQAQAFSVASAGKFFEGTSETPGLIYGFRIDNDGEADVKMVIISDTPFEGRLVPEPSTFLMGLGACLLFGFSRNRGRGPV